MKYTIFSSTALPNGFQYNRPRVEETKQMVGVMESQKVIALMLGIEVYYYGSGKMSPELLKGLLNVC